MPWWKHRGQYATEYYYSDPIALADKPDNGLMRVVREPWTWFFEECRLIRLGVIEPKHADYPDKYDLFNEYPFMEHLDYNRMIFEKIHGITEANEQDRILWAEKWKDDPRFVPEPYCCWPTGCILNSAIGSTRHWTWRFAFEKQLPYWQPLRKHKP